MHAIVEIDVSGVRQTQKHFVHESRALERHAALLVAHVSAGLRPQLRVHKGHEFIKRVLISLAPRLQQARDVHRIERNHFAIVVLAPDFRLYG